MKVLEIKNNLVKISYAVADNLLLAGFVIIEDEQKPYVAQVLSLKANSGINYAIVRLLFTFNEEGIVQNYDGSVPSIEASVTKLSSDELLDILPVSAPLEIGELAQQNFLLKVDFSLLEKNLLVCSENQENTNTLVSNFVLQLENNNAKSIIFDINGSYSGAKLKFGKDFKLPLNYDTINYIYEHELGNVDPASKAIIQDIFLEVQEYSKTVLDKFIPFDTFISVVDQQYKETELPELVLLKNKLLKYKEQNVFAQDAKDIQALRAAIRSNMTNILDISPVNENLQNEIMTYVYDAIDELNLFVYSFVHFTNENADKKLIRHFITKDKIYTTIVCSHNYKYLYELKERASNLIMFVPQKLQHDFAAYNTYLSKLNPDEFIIYGKSTQYIPLIVELTAIESETEEYAEEYREETEEVFQPESEIVTEEDEPARQDLPISDDFSDESNSYSYDTLLEDSAPVETEETDASEDLIEEKEEEQEEYQPAPEEISSIIDEEIEEENSTDYFGQELIPQESNMVQVDILDNEDIEEEFPNVYENSAYGELEPLEEKMSDDDLLNHTIEEEIFEEPEIRYDNSSLQVMEEPEIFEGATPMDKVAKDVDDLIFSREKQELPSIEETFESDAELTEDDLDYIEDVSDEEKTPVVPIYPVDETEAAILFEQGDRVAHPKYGEGIVEKMIKYGNKTLCSINFVNVGRRLLDPAISEISKA